MDNIIDGCITNSSDYDIANVIYIILKLILDILKIMYGNILKILCGILIIRTRSLNTLSKP